MSNFDAVGDFHQKFGLPNVTYGGVKPTLIAPSELMLFRLKFLQEELIETTMAMAEGDLPKAADGLVDLVYVALGTAHLMGLPWEEIFDEVQRSNMAKERAQPDGSNSTRGSSFDVIKPDGWRPPDIASILRRHGWRG